MELPSSIEKADFIHNAAAFIPFSYGEPYWLEIGREFLTHTYPYRSNQLRREAIGNSWYDFTNDHA